MTYFPKEIFTTIVDYCGETPKEKHAKVWKTIQPRIRRCAYTDEAILIVYDKTRGKSLEWFLELEERRRDHFAPVTQIEDFSEESDTMLNIEDSMCCVWSTEEDMDSERYDEEIDEPIY